MFYASLAVASDASQQPIVEVGIVEDVYFGDLFRVRPDALRKEFYRNLVRVAFYWTGDKWVSYQDALMNAAAGQIPCIDYWKRRNWFMRTSNGDYDSVVSAGSAYVPRALYYAGQYLESNPNIPDDRELTFSGWLGYPVLSPRVVCTQDNFPDVDRWSVLKELKVADLPPSIAERLAEFMKSSVLKKGSLADRLDRIEVLRFIVNVACVENATGARVYQLAIDIDSESPDLFEMPIQNPICIWTTESTGNSPRLLGDGLKYLFSGDLNGDGSSELIFWINRYNRNGYLLMDYRIHSLVSYEWSYH